MARRLRVTEDGKRVSFIGADTESVIEQFTKYGGESFNRHDANALIDLITRHEEIRIGPQLFEWDWTHPELDYCPVPPGYQWK
jgi:hypothetical protein